MILTKMDSSKIVTNALYYDKPHLVIASIAVVKTKSPDAIK